MLGNIRAHICIGLIVSLGEFPFDTEKYKAAKVLSMSFEGKYGYMKIGVNLHEKGEKSYEEIFFATKDGGENWIVWEEP